MLEDPEKGALLQYGEILVAAQMNSMNALQTVLDSSDWESLTHRLLDYVENFNFKVVQARGGFQM